MKLNVKKWLIAFAVVVFSVVLFFVVQSLRQNDRQKTTITIGYQTQCAQTWGALIIKNQKLYEKYLEQALPDKEFEVVWQDSPSGPPITNNMIAGKMQFGFMGDMPLLVNGSQGQNNDNYRSALIALDGKGLSGMNQAIMINRIDEGMSLADLAGKTVSVPFGSSAHRMLLAILEKNNLLDQVKIVNQDVATGLTALETEKIDAVSTWAPYPNHMLERGKIITLADGSLSGVDYLDGVVVDLNWAEANEVETVALIKALIEAHEFITANPEAAAQIFSAESGFSYEVSLSEAKSIYWDVLIYPADKVTLESDAVFLKSLDKIATIDIEVFLNTYYLQKAMAEEGIPYPDQAQFTTGWHEKAQ